MTLFSLVMIAFCLSASLMDVVGIHAASVFAKRGARYLAARAAGVDNPAALGIGALMNSRGLMELIIIIIIINIGLQKGIIGPTLFAMLVLMAIATTMMAGPLFDLFYRRRQTAENRLSVGEA